MPLGARLLIALLVGLAAAAPAAAERGRVAVGLDPGAPFEVTAARVAEATGGTISRELEPLHALIATVADVGRAVAEVKRLRGVEYAEPIRGSRSLAFVPADPLFASEQWYLPAVRAFDFWADAAPPFDPVLVAVIDSGVDGNHPDLKDVIAKAKSFVSSSAKVDTIGHGTMVAGLIAAQHGNGEGIAGLGFPVKLLIGKVVGSSGTISLEAEAKAIRWAVDQGARVINLSLGGPRDPVNEERDTYSALERAAVDYAYRKGAVVVAATGNCDAFCPYGFASYPAALPHVLGVSALDRDGRVPDFSNRDDRFNDLAAPGKGIVSTFPLDLGEPGCTPAGYSLCADGEYRRGEGTSFAAPLVSAAAALLIAQNRDLKPSQVIALLEQSAFDVGRPGRDKKTGNGRLDVQGALAALALPGPPLPDDHETNDDAGDSAYRLYFRGPRRAFAATLDRYDDPIDVYRVLLRRGERLRVALRSPEESDVELFLLEPGTGRISDLPARSLRRQAVRVDGPEANPRIVYRAEQSGWYYVEVKLTRGGGGDYGLAVTKTSG